MKISCPSCDASLNAPERLVGKKVKCPSCGEAVLVEDPDAAEELDDFLEEDDVEEPPRRRAPAKQACPMCGAENKATAETCGNCGEELRGNDDDETVIGADIWRDGKQLVMRKTAELPYRCVKTNQPADAWLRRKLHWHHPLVYLALLANLIIYAILALCLQKKADIRVGLCAAALGRRRWAIAIGWLSALSGVGLCIAGCAGAGGHNDEMMAAFVIAGMIVGIAGAITGMMLASVVTAAKINDDFVWLKGVCPAFLDEFPDWPGEEEMTPQRKRKR
jgi:hypothetical protein